MKNLSIIYGKSRNYKGIEFMDYSLIEKSSNENLMIKNYDFMRIGETKKQTKETYKNRLETQKKKLEEKGYNYRDVIVQQEKNELYEKLHEQKEDKEIIYNGIAKVYDMIEEGECTYAILEELANIQQYAK